MNRGTSAFAPVRFDGADYSPGDDDARLHGQLERVHGLMKDGAWRTLAEISARTGDPAASVSAQLRHLRKPRFGAWVVERRSRGERIRGLYEYRLLPPGSAPERPKRRSRAAERIKALEAEVAYLRAELAKRSAA